MSFLSNWRVIAALILLTALLSGGWYISHLHNEISSAKQKTKDAENERDKFKAQAEAATSYITVSEKVQNVNQDKTQALLDQVSQMPDSTCGVDADDRKLYDSLYQATINTTK